MAIRNVLFFAFVAQMRHAHCPALFQFLNQLIPKPGGYRHERLDGRGNVHTRNPYLTPHLTAATVYISNEALQ
jgi:hypothetical protein